MKFFAVILSIYLTSLSFIPCNDEAVVAIDSVSIEKGHTPDDHNDHNIDFCSPFCTCQCCHIEIISADSAVFTFASFEVITSEPSYFESKSKDYINNILQPPQV